VERSSASHAAHGEYVQLCPFPADVGIGFIPIDLSFNSPRIALRDEYLVLPQAHGDLSFLHVLANRSFSHLAIGQLLANPHPDPMRRVPLFPGSFLVTL
jgi:hypothetical protein